MTNILTMGCQKIDEGDTLNPTNAAKGAESTFWNLA